MITQFLHLNRIDSTFFSANQPYDNLDETMRVKCPKCGREVEYSGNEYRPFCSERCKLLDLGAWADEEYSLPAEPSEMTEVEIAEIEKAMEEKK